MCQIIFKKRFFFVLYIKIVSRLSKDKICDYNYYSQKIGSAISKKNMCTTFFGKKTRVKTFHLQ